MGLFYVLEFGGQHTDLICNRLEVLGHDAIYSESTTPLEEMKGANGIIISGGPKSVDDRDSFPYDPRIFGSGMPVLGICYGFQLIVNEKGGRVFHGNREYGMTKMKVTRRHPLLDGVPDESIVWMNHGDSGEIDEEQVIARSDKNIIGVQIGNNYGVQFHPELLHSEYGKQILDNFARRICNATPRKTKSKIIDATSYLENAVAEIRRDVGDKKALALLSGGVDSTVAYITALKAGVPVIGVHIETGTERKNEAKKVTQFLEELSGQEIFVYDISDKVINVVSKLSDSEDKRKAFQRIWEEARKEIPDWLGYDIDDLVQILGTIETDRRETGREAARRKGQDFHRVATIKTHHNVPYDDSTLKSIKTIEPLRHLTKELVREVAKEFGLPEYIIKRKPFPGPGQVVRIISGVYPYSDDLSLGIDKIVGRYELHGFATPIKTVGLKGDNRAYEHLALVTGEQNWDNIIWAQKYLAEELPICRTSYWHPSWSNDKIDPGDFKSVTRGLEFNRQNIALLQEATEIAENAFVEYKVETAQLPVIAFPGPRGIWIGIRDVHTQDFRSLRPLKKPEEMPWKLVDVIASRILNSPEVERYGDVAGIVLDASTKPAATTEWE